LFESKKHYYKSLLTVTDYLLQFLQVDRNHSLPILLEHADTWIEEVHVQMRLHLLVVTRTSSSFILKKYLAFDHPIYTESLQHMIRLFCHHHLNGLSGRIEIVNPLEGKITKFDLDPSDIQSSLDYMRLMKEMKQDEWHAGLRFLN